MLASHRQCLAWVGLGAIVVVSLVLRMYHIGRQVLWLDELSSIQTSSGYGLGLRYPADVVLSPAPDLISLEGAPGWWETITNIARFENHPPLHFLMLRGWRMLFGDSEAALRTLSVLAAVGAIVLLFDAVRMAHGKAAALWAGALMALATPQIQFSQEARGYMLLLCFGAGVLWAMVRIERGGATRGTLWILGSSALLMTLTHYYAVGPLLGVAIYGLFMDRPKRRAVLLTLIAAGIAYALIWGPGLWMQVGNLGGNNEWVRETEPGHFARTIKRLAKAPALLLLDPDWPGVVELLVSAVLLALPLALVRRNRLFLLWWLWMVMTIALVLGVDVIWHARQLEILRYTLAGSLGACAILAGATEVTLLERRWLMHVAPAALVALSIIALPRAYHVSRVPRSPWRELAGDVRPRTSDDDLLILWTGSRTMRKRYHYLGYCYYVRKPGAVVILEHEPSEAVREAMARAGNVWMFSLDEEVPPWTGRMGYRVEVLPERTLIAKLMKLTPPGR